jgi:hypothetical protein
LHHGTLDCSTSITQAANGILHWSNFDKSVIYI